MTPLEQRMLNALTDLVDTIDRDAIDVEDWIGAELREARAAIAAATNTEDAP